MPQHPLGKELEKAFSGLEFDPIPHKYYLDGEEYTSVSKTIELFYDKFDSQNVSLGYSKKHGFEQEDVLFSWEGEGDLSCISGTRCHVFGEDYVKWKFFGEGEKPKPTCKQCLAIIQFWNDLPSHYQVVALEQRMFSRRFKRSGTADIIVWDSRVNKLSIFDYKTNKELESNFDNGRMKHLKTYLKQDNLGKYTIQFSTYQLMLEEAGFEVSSRYIIWLREQPDKKLYKILPTVNIVEQVKSALMLF